MSFLLSFSCCPGFQHIRLFVTSTALGFLCILLPPCELSLSRASAMLGPTLWGPPHGATQTKIVSARLNPRPVGFKAPDMLRECVIFLVLSHHSKDLKWRTCVTALLQLSFIWQAKDSTPWKCEGGLTPKERLSLGSSFCILFLLPLSLPFVNWASQEGCLLHLRFSLQFADFLLSHLCRLFPFFVF